jgi:hypothetical protein
LVDSEADEQQTDDSVQVVLDGRLLAFLGFIQWMMAPSAHCAKYRKMAMPNFYVKYKLISIFPPIQLKEVPVKQR